MSGIEQRLVQLREQGIRLWVEGDKLRVRAPEGALGPELTAELKARKGEILALLSPLPDIAAVPEQDSYPLSPAQRRLWVLAQMEEGSCAYNIPLHQFLEGPLDREALALALHRVVQRHESLRTVFRVLDGEPRQVVHPAMDIALECQDLSHLNEPEAAARRLGREEAQKPFDLERGPLLRAVLLRLADQAHVLLFTLHHIIADGISIAVLSRDLSRCYDAALTGEAGALPPLAFGYAAYAVWQERLLASGAIAAHRRYWHDQLSGELPLLNLLTDFPRPPLQTYSGQELSFLLPPARTQGLRDYCRQRSASLFMLLHAALKALLHAYSGQEDIIIGCAAAGRDQTGLQDQIGYYLNTLALRSHIRPGEPFDAFFLRVKQATSEAFDHQIYPFDQLLTELQVKRDLSRFPLFDVVLVLQSQDEPGLAMGGLRARPVFEHPGTSKFDLTFCFKDTDAGLVLGIEYNTDLFLEARVRRMGRHFMTLLESILADPSQAVGRLAILPREEAELIRSFSASPEAFPIRETLPALFEAQAAKTPEAVAVAFGGDRLSYGELNARANRLARHLRVLGVGPDTLVGLCAERGPELIVGLLAVLKAGGAYVPLDPDYPARRLAQMLEDSRPLVLLTDARGRTHLADAGAGIPRLDLSADRGLWGNLPADDVKQRDLTPAHLAYVIYTSGSTGKPKGVMVEHRGVVNLLRSFLDILQPKATDAVLALTTIAFDIAALELYLPLLCGARLVLADRSASRDPALLADLLESQGVTLMQATPATWRMLLDAGWTGASHIKALCGGEALPMELASALSAVTGDLWNVYGPTETTIWSSFWRVEPGEAGHGVHAPIGRPIANTSIHVLDPRGNPVPLGVAGELHIGGAGVARGYWNSPELTGQRFLKDPFSPEPGARLYRTGDLGRWREDGTLEFLGRNDFQVKIRGFRIELGEIESALAAFPGILQAAVDVRQDQAGGQRLLAWYVPERGLRAGPSELRGHLAARLPEYMLPVSFIPLETLPLTPNGKLDRKALEVSEAEGHASAPYQPPATCWEHIIAALWQELLEIPRVGRHDNFFALGGHSLMATRFIARLRQETSARLELMDLFRQPDLEGLAALASRRQEAPESEPSEVPVSPVTDQELEMLNGW